MTDRSLHVSRPSDPTELDDGAPAVRAWEAERVRLELAHACALRQLLTHMGEPAWLSVPFDGEILEIKKVKPADAR